MVSQRECLDEFTRRLAAAAASKPALARAALAQAIVEAGADCVGAISAACYARDLGGPLQRLAAAGLFPPLQAIDEVISGKLSTRVHLIERVLRAEEPVPAESVLGRVAATGRGELIADATADSRIPKHADPALTVRSIIFVPLRRGGESHGVLVFVNPVTGRPFTSEDFALAESIAGLAATALAAG